MGLNADEFNGLDRSDAGKVAGWVGTVHPREDEIVARNHGVAILPSTLDETGHG